MNAKPATIETNREPGAPATPLAGERQSGATGVPAAKPTRRRSIDPARLQPGDQFRVAGSRDLFRHYDLFRNARGNVTSLRCWSETAGQWRTLYVGKRPTKVHGMTLRPYRITKIIRPKRSA